jgi:hypothetical protein
MDPVSPAKLEELKSEWTDQFVRINPAHSELKRFDGLIGRVVTVNWNGKALVDFADGGWYDVTASSKYLQKVPAEEAKGKFDAAANSAQPFPARQA